MIRALVSGTLYDQPQSRTSQSGNTFALCKVKADDKAGAWVWVSAIAFGDAAERLLQLKAGDSVSIAGRAELGTWQDKDGHAHPSLSLVADEVTETFTTQSNFAGTGGIGDFLFKRSNRCLHHAKPCYHGPSPAATDYVFNRFPTDPVLFGDGVRRHAAIEIAPDFAVSPQPIGHRPVNRLPADAPAQPGDDGVHQRRALQSGIDGDGNFVAYIFQ